MTGLSDAEGREFAAAFLKFLNWAHSTEVGSSEVTDTVLGFLDEDVTDKSVVTRSLSGFEQVNLQTALNAWSSEPGRDVTVQGISIPPHHQEPNLQQIITGEGIHHLGLSAPGLVDLPNGPGTTLACLKLAVLLVSDDLGRYVVMVSGPSEHGGPGISVEIAGLSIEAAQTVHSRLDGLRHSLNVYRGQILEVSLTPTGTVALEFGDLPTTSRDDVVLPEEVLARVETHALGVATHRERLLKSGQHLKRGLLLYGPPGTGKTHTTRYLIGRMDGYTRLVLSGRSLHAIGSASELARDLEPAVIVLEDVDLVAGDRSFGPGGTPVLFELLNAMDGAAGDADLLFVLTTNRADLLEPALAARPGRVDVAVEIGLPEADARRRLFSLYARDISLQLEGSELDQIVARTEGVTASFLKELLRRSVLVALGRSETEPVLTAAVVSEALDDLLDTTQRLTRSLLGVGNDPDELPAGGGLGSLPPERGRVRRRYVN